MVRKNRPTFEDNLMFTSNPFAELTVFLPSNAMQVYIILMIIAVVLGTIAPNGKDCELRT